MPKDSVVPIELTSLNSGSVVPGAYTAINPGGTEAPCFSLSILNASNQTIRISFDGTTDHDILSSDKELPIEFQTFSAPANYRALLPAGTVVYVKGTTGTGEIHLSGFTYK